MGNTAKDEAERRAVDLAGEVVTWKKRGEGLWCDLAVCGRFVSAYAPDVVENIAGFWRDALTPVVASAIREAIESRDRILTDMLSESEAFHEGWRQGAVAMRSAIAKYEPRIGDWKLPQPPSHDGNCGPLTPSPVHLRAQRMERALCEILKFDLQTGDSLAHPLHLAQRIAREALEE